MVSLLGNSKKVASGKGIMSKCRKTLNKLITYGLKKASDNALKVARKHFKSIGCK